MTNDIPVITEQVLCGCKGAFLHRDLTEMPSRTCRLLNNQLLHIAKIHSLDDERAHLNRKHSTTCHNNNNNNNNNNKTSFIAFVLYSRTTRIPDPSKKLITVTIIHY